MSTKNFNQLQLLQINELEIKLHYLLRLEKLLKRAISKQKRRFELISNKEGVTHPPQEEPIYES